MQVYTSENYSYVRIAKIAKDEIDKIDFALCQQPKETLASFYNRQTYKPDLLTNAGFFALNTGETIFNCICDGKVVSSNNLYQWGMGIIGDNELRYGSVTSRNWRCFLSGYPNLLDSGIQIPITFAQELNYKARRTMIGYSEKYIYIVCVENPGMDFNEMQNLMYRLGCNFAINLDGGGSTKMLYKGKIITTDSYNRAVDTVIAVYLKDNDNVPSKIEDKKIYRVQTASFSKEIYAKAYLDRIKALGGVYASAYIRIVGGLYKIQVGAFTNKTLADNLAADLKSKGFTAFVTTN